MRRTLYSWKIRLGLFRHDEPEYARLGEWISQGDCVLDVGANVGVYTALLSKLVGPGGHVFAFEPMPETFHLLAYNARLFQYSNVTLFNAAASDAPGLVGIEMPRGSNGLPDIYVARVVDTPAATMVCALAIDSLSLPSRVSFVKIDVEGHEMNVLRGMQELLRRHKPVLLVEGWKSEIKDFLNSLGYADQRLPGSPNRIFQISA